MARAISAIDQQPGENLADRALQEGIRNRIHFGRLAVYDHDPGAIFLGGPNLKAILAVVEPMVRQSRVAEAGYAIYGGLEPLGKRRRLSGSAAKY